MQDFSSQTGSFLLLLGSAVWLGAFIMLGYGVAPVNFGLAAQWELTGVNPVMEEQPVNYRTIGGALTGTSILRLNIIESFCLILIVAGLLFNWRRTIGTERNRMVLSALALFTALMFYYYAIHVGGRLTELRTTVPIDFSITEQALKSAAHHEFDRLHRTYTRVASINMISLFALFTLSVFTGFPADSKSEQETPEQP
ncbi:MAG: hypothetical protein LAT67_15470 [Balneolales bacterium]|nr:hypothetical protein [Balneolales bacterium]